MSVHTVQPLTAPDSRLQVVQVKTLELFIVTPTEKARPDCRVHLLLATDAGTFVSELVLEAWEKPADWVTWSYGLRKILHAGEPRDVQWLERQLCENSAHARLVRSALQPLGECKKTDRAKMRSALIDRASNYICLF